MTKRPSDSLDHMSTCISPAGNVIVFGDPRGGTNESDIDISTSARGGGKAPREDDEKSREYLVDRDESPDVMVIKQPVNT